MLKRYWLFGGEGFYASGGVHDFIQSFATLEEAVAVGIELAEQPELEYEVQWWHVADISAMQKVAESEAQPYGRWTQDKLPAKLG